MQTQKAKGEQHRPPSKPGVKSCAHEEYTVQVQYLAHLVICED